MCPGEALKSFEQKNKTKNTYNYLEVSTWWRFTSKGLRDLSEFYIEFQDL